jgi:RHS repeat-associated protein
VASYSYDAYGNTTASSGTASTPLRYAGQFQDPESDLYYLQARYYDPATAQFISRDPIGSSGEPYSYAADSPTNNVDDTGQSCEPATPPDQGGGVQEFATFYVTIDCWTEGDTLHWQLTPYGYGVTRGKTERLNYQVFNPLGIPLGRIYDSQIEENERGIPLTAGKPLKEGTAACVSGTWTFVLSRVGQGARLGYNTFGVNCSDGGGGGAPVVVGAAAILGLIAWLCSKLGKLPKPPPLPPFPWPPRPGPLPVPTF